MKKIICLVTLYLVSTNNIIVAQTYFTDSVSVVTYNVNNYGFASTGSCPLTGSSLKHQYLKTVMQYLAPDIVAFEKINGTPASFSIDTIQKKIMDSVCIGCYSSAAFTNVSGYKKVLPTTRIGLSVGIFVFLDKKKKEEALPKAE